MADPTRFVRSFDFSEYQSDNPAAPYPGAQDDAQFDAVAASISSVIQAIKDIRRSDGALKNAVVTPDSLSSSSLNLIGMGGYTVKGAWLTGSSYAVGDVVTQGAGLATYVCGVAHTAGVFATDLAAGLWVLLASTSSAYITEAQARTFADEEIESLAVQKAGSTMTGDLTILKATPVINLDKAASAQASVIRSRKAGVDRWYFKLADETAESGGNAGSNVTLDACADDGSFLGTALQISRATRKVTFTQQVAAADAVAASDLVTLQQMEAMWIGAEMTFASGSAPPGFLLEYGQAVSRTTYAKLFGKIGTTYGTGDGSTTFNLPDKRGRVTVGRDDMGGPAAGRVTSAISGIDGATRGATGGDQRMQQHDHPVTELPHDHLIFDQTGGIGGVSSGTRYANITIASNTGGAKRTDVATTGITVGNAGSGNSQNMPPAIIMDWYIFAGTV